MPSLRRSYAATVASALSAGSSGNVATDNAGEIACTAFGLYLDRQAVRVRGSAEHEAADDGMCASC